MSLDTVNVNTEDIENSGIIKKKNKKIRKQSSSEETPLLDSDGDDADADGDIEQIPTANGLQSIVLPVTECRSA